MSVTLYVLRCKRTGKRYVGITNNLPRRLREHASAKTKAGQLLRDLEVVHTEECDRYVTARIRERYLKSGQGREWLDEVERTSWPASGG